MSEWMSYINNAFQVYLRHGEVVSLMAHSLASITGKCIYDFERGCKPYGPPSLPL